MQIISYRTKSILAGMASLFIAMGVARFLYTPLMPLMQQEQNFGDIWGGTLGTVNFSGYLLGALITIILPAGKIKLYAFRVGIILALISTPMMIFHDQAMVILLSRFLGGISGALAMIIGSSLLLQSLPVKNSLSGMGLNFSGVGIGIAATGAMVILFGQKFGADYIWALASIISLPLGLVAWFWIPKPIISNRAKPAENILSHKIPWNFIIIITIIAYFLEGGAYVIDASFLVRIFKINPELAPFAEWIWVMLGLAAIPASYGWAKLGIRLGHLKALLLAYMVQTIGILLPILLPNLFGATIGAIMFGGTFLGIVALTMALGGKFMPSHPARLMGAFTAAFGMSQMVGPVVSGWILEITNNADLPLILGGILSIICVILTAISIWYDQCRRI